MSAVYSLSTRTVLRILETSWQAAVLAAVVVLLGLLLRDRLSARWRCALWLVVVVRLLMPIVPASPVSLFNLLPIDLASSGTVDPGEKATGPLVDSLPAPTKGPQLVDPGMLPPDRAVVARPHSPAASQLHPAAKKSQRFTAETIWLLVASGWVLGALILTARMIVLVVRLRLLLGRCEAVESADVRQVFEATRRELRLRRRVELLASPLGVGPAVAGFFRPKLIVSRAILDRLSSDELRLVFLHEFSHVRRHDLAVQQLWMLAQTLHWFNPVVWLAARRWQADRELACDEAVLARLDRPDQAGYGRAILRVMELLSPILPVPGTVGAVMGQRFLTRRIAMIVRYRPLSRRWTFLAAGLLLLLVPVGLTNAVGQADRSAATQDTTTTASGQTSPAPAATEADAKAKAGRDAAAEKTTTIAGLCVDENGQPIDGADVTCYELRDLLQPERKVAAGQTDRQGTFQFADLPAPWRDSQHVESLRYRVLAKKAGRASAGAFVRPEDPRPYHLRLVMPPAATLTGRVTDQEGKPIKGASVCYGPYSQPEEGIQASQTDERGRFEIGDTAAWGPKYHVATFAYVRHPDYAFAQIPVQQIPSTVEIALEPAATIQGRVIDRVTGKPAAGVAVAAQATNDSYDHYYGNRVLTGSDGRYRLTCVSSCKLNIWPIAKDRTAVAIDSFAIRAGQTREAPDLELIEGGFLEGRVMDAATGKPIVRTASGRVGVATYGPAHPRSGAAVQGTDVDEDGRFRMRVPPGIYDPYIGNSDFRSNGYIPRGFNSGVEVKAGQTSRVEFYVLPPSNAEQRPGSWPLPLRNHGLPPGADSSPSTERYLYRMVAPEWPGKSPAGGVPKAPRP